MSLKKKTVKLLSIIFQNKSRTISRVTSHIIWINTNLNADVPFKQQMQHMDSGRLKHISGCLYESSQGDKNTPDGS